VFQIVDYSSVNDLKFIYMHLQFQKFFPGVIPPDPHNKGEGRGGEGGMGVNPPKTNPVYGPAPLRPRACQQQLLNEIFLL
jgi:hypothetical protein